MRLNEVEDAPSQVFVLDQKQLRQQSDAILLNEELLILGEGIYAVVRALAQDQVHDLEGQYALANRLAVPTHERWISESVSEVDQLRSFALLVYVVQLQSLVFIIEELVSP